MSPTEARTFAVREQEHRLRIDRFLKKADPALSHGTISALLRTGHVLINGRPRGFGYYVKSGDRIVVTSSGDDDAGPPRLLLVTKEMAVVAKPPGYSTNPAGGKERSLLDWLRSRLSETTATHPPGLVHRLDRGTSGLVLFSRTPGSHRAILAGLRAQKIRKRYLALVSGAMRPLRGSIDLPLIRDRSGTVRPDSRGSRARTEYRTLQRSERASLLEINPRTGRMHQIRVHLASRGRPIAGDPLYGDPKQSLGAPRLWLHASQITLPPALAERLGASRQLACPLWEDLKHHLSEIGIDYEARKT
jgi:23S rRNA pseudouridine1911/1915/1917 synthase